MLLPLQRYAKFKFTTIKEEWCSYYIAIAMLQTITIYLFNWLSKLLKSKAFCNISQLSY